MCLFDIIAILLALSALFSRLNHRILKPPTAVGLMLIALTMFLAILVPRSFKNGFEQQAAPMLGTIDFERAR